MFSLSADYDVAYVLNWVLKIFFLNVKMNIIHML